MLDLLIKNGTIIDGTGNPRYNADIAIEKGVISRIEPRIDDAAIRTIDADGLFISPGFIDTHSHYDFTALLASDCALLLEQGVTTQLVGNCGDSMTPYPSCVLDPKIPSYLTDEQILSLKQICASPDTFMAHASGQAYGVNTAFLIGHNSLRLNAIGSGNVKATDSQLKSMKEMVRLAMEEGMFGFSSGLAYAPSSYADTEELSELAKVAAEYGGIYASHIRNEGNHVLDAVAEAIQIGEASGAAVLISHIKIMGNDCADRAVKVLELIQNARERGLNVFADQYPYEAASAPLLSQIHPKYLANGLESTLRMIADPAMRKQLEQSVFEDTPEFESCLRCSGYAGSVIVEANKTPQYIGLSIADAAKADGKEPIEFMMDLLLENNGEVRCTYFTQQPDDILTFLKAPFVYTGDDWAVLGNRPDPDKNGGGHPRGTAAFVRKIELARDHAHLIPEACIFRMTGGPAGALGLTGRGFIRETYAADLCILDYDHVYAEADYLHPFRRNHGIRYVIVNGQIAVENGYCNGKKYGKALLRNAKPEKENYETVH